MGKMPEKRDPHPDAVVRVAIFGISENIKKLTERLTFARARGVDPDWTLCATIQLQAIQAWSSNLTAVQALGVITSDELSTALQNLSVLELLMKDLLEAEAGKKPRTDKQRLTDFKATISFLMGEIEDMASSQLDCSDDLDDIGSDLNDLEDKMEAVLAVMKDD